MGAGHVSVCWLLVTATSAVYFPMSEVHMYIPPQLGTDAVLLRVVALQDDGTAVPPGTASYSVWGGSALVGISSVGGDLRLGDGRRGNSSTQVTVTVTVTETGEQANMSVTLVLASADDCDAMVQELCFWPLVRYQVYENRPASTLGPMGPAYMAIVCPQHSVNYSVSTASRYVSVGGMLRTRDLLDRERADRDREVQVSCTVSRLGLQHTANATLGVTVMDDNDNPPVTVSAPVSHVYLQEARLSQGAALAAATVTFEDNDSVDVNRYNITLLQDDQDLVYPDCREEEVLREPPDGSNGTAVHCVLVATRTAQLSKDMYTVVIWINDTTMTTPGNSVPAHANATVILHRAGRTSPPTPASTLAPAPTPALAPALASAPTAYPKEVNILRGATLFARVVQPVEAQLAQPAQYRLTNMSWALGGGVGPFNITPSGGIIYVSDILALRTAPQLVRLVISWDTADAHTVSWTSVNVSIVNGTSAICRDSHGDSHRDSDSVPVPAMCSSQSDRGSCMSLCGLGTGGIVTDKEETTRGGGCTWHDAGVMSRNYSTCTPDVTTCPDGTCDPLEDTNPALCPQDCVRADKVTVNGTVRTSDKISRGIPAVAGVCTCDATGMCTCVTHKEHKHQVPTVDGAGAGTEDSTTGGTSRCGALCQLAIVIGCLLLLLLLIAFAMWWYKQSHGAIVCPDPPTTCAGCTICTNCTHNRECNTPCARYDHCASCTCCQGTAALTWLRTRLGMTESSPPRPPMAAPPSSHVSGEFVQSVDSHLLPYSYMAPLGTLNPMHPMDPDPINTMHK